VLAIALPLVLSTASFAVMLFVDRMFLLWHSSEEMAASMPAGMLHWTMLCLPMGVASYVTTFVAQYHGAGRPDRIGLVTWQGFRIGLYTTPLFLCTIPLAPHLFPLAGHAADVVAYETIYFQVLGFGAGATVMAEAVGAFFTGRGQTRVVMVVNVLAALLNIGLDYLWIFGRAGFPEMGIEGAALATVLSQWFKLAAYLAIMHRRPLRHTFQLSAGRRLDGPLLRRLVWYGGPNGMQYLVESSVFTLITLKMGQFGATPMVATTLAFNVNAVVFIPMIGVGIAVSTLVGQQLTRGRPDLGARATWTAVTVGIAYTSVFAVLYLFAPDVFMLGHASGVDPERFIEIHDLTVLLLRFVAAYCLFDTLQIILVGAIKGAGDTWFVLVSTTIICCTTLLVGWIGALVVDVGLLWWWFVVTGWILSLAVTYLARFLQGRWRRMRVIEPTRPEGDLKPASEPAEPRVAAFEQPR